VLGEGDHHVRIGGGLDGHHGPKPREREGAEQGELLMLPARRRAPGPLSLARACVTSHHVGLSPALVDEDQQIRVELLHAFSEGSAFGRHVGPVLLGGAQ